MNILEYILLPGVCFEASSNPRTTKAFGEKNAKFKKQF